uniref:Uncharacterized protein n=1 Tax=Sphaerodactylus townsendi TaxID=933632 RepID=A0ACB8FVN8_9SAUR
MILSVADQRGVAPEPWWVAGRLPTGKEYTPASAKAMARGTQQETLLQIQNKVGAQKKYLKLRKRTCDSENQACGWKAKALLPHAREAWLKAEWSRQTSRNEGEQLSPPPKPKKEERSEARATQVQCSEEDESRDSPKRCLIAGRASWRVTVLGKYHRCKRGPRRPSVDYGGKGATTRERYEASEMQKEQRNVSAARGA